MKLTKAKLKQLIQESITTSLLEAMCGPDESGQWVDGKQKCVKNCAPQGSANLMGLPECPPKKDDEDQEDESKKRKKRKKRTKKNPSSRKSKIKCKYTDKVHGRCKDKKQNFANRNRIS